MTEARTPSSLLDAMTTSFNMNELRQLCFAIGVDDEELPQFDSKSSLALALIKYTWRRDTLDQLIDQCARERPHITWHQLQIDLPDTQVKPKEKKSHFHVSTGNITNSQINIAGQDITIQQADLNVSNTSKEND